MLRLEGIEIVQDDWRMTADLALAAGSTTAFIGPSGSGKSTLLNVIAGFVDLARGRVTWEGRDLTELPPADRPVTLLFQDHNLFAHLTAAQNVGLGLRPDLEQQVGRDQARRKDDADQNQQRDHEVARKVELAETRVRVRQDENRIELARHPGLPRSLLELVSGEDRAQVRADANTALAPGQRTVWVDSGQGQ